MADGIRGAIEQQLISPGNQGNAEIFFDEGEILIVSAKQRQGVDFSDGYAFMGFQGRLDQQDRSPRVRSLDE